MSKPLTGYEKEIAILHAEANQNAELIEEFKRIAYEYKQAIERVRKVHKPTEPNGDYCHQCGYTYPCDTIQALDGDD